MFRRSALLAVALAAPVAVAQPPAPPAAAPPVRFKWAAGQTLAYKVTQATTVRETTLDEKTEKPVVTETRTALALAKSWAVRAVEPTGVATLEMTITAMRSEFRKPDGTTVVTDSANPEDAKQMAAYLNVPVVTVRVDPQGRLVEVKEAKAGGGRLQAELPFRVVLPDAGPATGQAWDRTFALKLDPPLGTGESYDFAQMYSLKAAKDGLLVIGVETALKSPPKTAAEKVPLVPMLWAGEVYFNPAAGKLYAVRLKAKAELPNHQGEGTKFEYESVYTEDAVEK
jgi:hypothetical protein